MPTDPNTLAAVAALDTLRAACPRILFRNRIPNPATVLLTEWSRHLAGPFRNDLRRAEEAIDDALPALTPEDFSRLANGDREVRGEIERFRDGRWSLVDVTDLTPIDLETGRNTAEDGETWTILRGSSRFEVREVPRFEAQPSARSEQGHWIVWDYRDGGVSDIAADDGEGLLFDEAAARACAEQRNADAGAVWIVWDTDRDEDASLDRHGYIREYHEDYDREDEDSARAAAEAANVEDYRTNAYGWPFAHNYAAAIDERDADDFDAAGFVVARHEPSGQVYAGIDGGGYDFIEAHWSRVYLRFMLPAVRGVGVFRTEGPMHIYVPTRDGLRRVVRGDQAGV